MNNIFALVAIFVSAFIAGTTGAPSVVTHTAATQLFSNNDTQIDLFVKTIFSSLDINNDGHITQTELDRDVSSGIAAKVLPVNSTIKVSDFDTNSDGFIDVQELTVALGGLLKAHSFSDLNKLYLSSNNSSVNFDQSIHALVEVAYKAKCPKESTLRMTFDVIRECVFHWDCHGELHCPGYYGSNSTAIANINKRGLGTFFQNVFAGISSISSFIIAFILAGFAVSSYFLSDIFIFPALIFMFDIVVTLPFAFFSALFFLFGFGIFNSMNL